MKARASLPRANKSGRPFATDRPEDVVRWRRSGYPRARLVFVGEAKDGLRGGLRGASFSGLGGLSEAPLVGEMENRRGGSFNGLACTSAAVTWDREDIDIRRGGAFSGLAGFSSAAGEAVFLLFLGGSSMSVWLPLCALCN